MEPEKFSGILRILCDSASNGSKDDIDFIMAHLTDESNFKMTRFVDYALSLVNNPEGVDRIVHFLFRGSLIQRNYSSLYLNRIGLWKPVRDAFDEGLIDEVQAFSR